MNDIGKLVTMTASILVMASVFAVVFQNPDEKFIRHNKCNVESVVESSERIYCGKACSQAADNVTYYCPIDNSTRTILEKRQ